MQVILLAAGQSTRLDPISDKNVLQFSGITLIEHQLTAIKRAKLRDVVIVAGAHNIEQLKQIFRKTKNVAVVEQKKLADGMAGGVLAGAEYVKHSNVMIMSTNDVFEPTLFEKAVQASKGEVDGLIVGSKVEGYFPGGYLEFDKKGFVTKIVEKPVAGKEPSKYVNLVFHIYNDFPAFVKTLKAAKGKADGLYEVALSTYIKKDKAKIAMLKYHGYWQPIKFPWHVTRVMEHFLEQQVKRIDKSAKVSKEATLEGNVVIGPKVKVLAGAMIKGPAYIGEGSIVGTGAMVRESMVGTNCVIGFGTEVTRSYLNNDVWCHTNYIGDSIVDSNVSFGAGTVLGNLRFDEGNVNMTIKGKKVDTGTPKFGAVIGRGARFGINVSTNPGVKVGRNSFVGGNVLVDTDVPDDKTMLLKQQLKVVMNKTSADNAIRKTLK
jgi:UDP-N-acetylglucosamine diphosphorylase / glucose-1-phosphate thymidylyltransferase / UDP-N-acetylgalactosamine diphosphorylase / glucosamine-1-phosphate N-acetyltransferase / galactosamine-1-phosphate N-acetyltransferase